jgi:hypothetical protein
MRGGCPVTRPSLDAASRSLDRGSDGNAAIRILRCVRRRNGSIDYDVVLARVTSYGAFSMLAIALGALIGFVVP